MKLLPALALFLLTPVAALAQAGVEDLSGTWIGLETRIIASEGDTLRVPSARLLILQADGDSLGGTHYTLYGNPGWDGGTPIAQGASGASGSVAGTIGGVEGSLVRARVTLQLNEARSLEYEVTVLPSGDRLRLTPAFESILEPVMFWKAPSVN